MRLMGSILRTAALAAGATLAAASVQAATISYDSTLANGVYYGSGNVDGTWTADTENGFQIALRGKLYKSSLITPDGTPQSNYTAPTGLYSSTTHWTWNFDYSIENIDGASNTTYGDGLTGLTANLSISDGTNSSNFDALAIADNATYLVGGTVEGMQNSENLVWGFLPGANPWLGKTYAFTLTLNQGETTLASTSITVDAVPEPASMALLGAGLLGLAARRRRRAA